MDKFSKISKSNHFKYGAPFILSIIGGSFGLKYFSELRYEIQSERHIMTKTKALQEMINPKKEVTIEEEYEEYKKKVDLDNWKNIRGPRPWETDNMDYKQVIEKRAEEAKNQWTFRK